MICFDVYRNGSKLCRAGVPNGVLTATITWVGDEKTAPSPALNVGGLTEVNGEDIFVDWRKHIDLQVGDEIVLRILEADAADPPVSTKKKSQ